MERDITKIPEWAQQDIEDMENSRRTSFHRCSVCGRLSDEGYICFYCGEDDSLNEDKEN